MLPTLFCLFLLKLSNRVNQSEGLDASNQPVDGESLEMIHVVLDCRLALGSRIEQDKVRTKSQGTVGVGVIGHTTSGRNVLWVRHSSQNSSAAALNPHTHISSVWYMELTAEKKVTIVEQTGQLMRGVHST